MKLFVPYYNAWNDLTASQKIISDKQQYLKQFNYAQTINSNTWNHWTVREQMIGWLVGCFVLRRINPFQVI